MQVLAGAACFRGADCDRNTAAGPPRKHGTRVALERETVSMILEGIVTSVSADGAINIAPMGPRVDPAVTRLILRPFPTSQTYRNLKAHGEGVLHVTDDVLLLVRAALGPVDPPPALRPASTVRGFVLQDACRFYEFQVRSLDEREERVRIDAEV